MSNSKPIKTDNKMCSTIIDDKQIPIHVDSHGNLYFEFANKLFQLNVDEHNQPYFIENTYDITTLDSLRQFDGKIVKANVFNSEYFPEENGYKIVSDDDEYDDEVYDEGIIKFYDNDSKLKIYDRNGGNIDAIYDVFVYNENELVFETKWINDVTIYRTVIYSNGDFYFRLLGCDRETEYKLGINDNKIIVNKK